MSSRFEITRDLRIIELVLETARTKNRFMQSKRQSGFVDIAAFIRVNAALTECLRNHESIKSRLEESPTDMDSLTARLLDLATLGNETQALYVDAGAVLVEIEFLYDEVKGRYRANALNAHQPTPMRSSC